MNNLTLSADQGAKVFVLTDIDCLQFCTGAQPVSLLAHKPIKICLGL